MSKETLRRQSAPASFKPFSPAGIGSSSCRKGFIPNSQGLMHRVSKMSKNGFGPRRCKLTTLLKEPEPLKSGETPRTVASHQLNSSESQPRSYLPTIHIEEDLLISKTASPITGIHSSLESQENSPFPNVLASSKFMTTVPIWTVNKGEDTPNSKLKKDSSRNKCMDCGKGFRHIAALTMHKIRHGPASPCSAASLPTPSDMDGPHGRSSVSAELNSESEGRSWEVLWKWMRRRPPRKRLESLLPVTDGHQNTGTAQNYHSQLNPPSPSPSNRPVNNLTGRVFISPESYKHPISGGLSLVYRGELDGKPVAVKVPQIREMQKLHYGWYSDVHRRSNREVDTGHILSHRNINELLGFATDIHEEHLPALIFPWCEHRTVRDYLDKAKPPIQERIGLAQDITQGLLYIHKQKLVHGDIKPTNALVDDELVGLVCDLGCVQPIPGHGYLWMVTEAPYTGTVRYKAPELFISPDNPRPKPTTEGDIYALGCLLMEIIEEIWTFDGIDDNNLKERISNGTSPGSRPQASKLPEDSADKFWGLLEDSWGEAASRPTIEDVAEVLSSLNPRV